MQTVEKGTQPVSGERGPKGSVRFDRARLKHARYAAELTQQDVADQADLGVDSVRRAERGVSVALQTAWAIAACLGIPLGDLLATSDAPDPITADPEPSAPVFPGVPPRIRTFMGRGAELDRLHTILTSGKPAAVTQATIGLSPQLGRAVAHGMGGVGKTMLAVEYVSRYRHFYTGGWWCEAETPASLLTSLARLATELGVATAAEPDIEKAAKAALRRLAEQRANFLLIYDNVTSPEAITDLLPAAGASVLITSRFSDWSNWAESVALDVLPLAEAVAFLEKRTGYRDETGAAGLSIILGCLPLALDHAAAYCSLAQMAFAKYAAKAERLIAELPLGTSYPRSVAATFHIAISEVVDHYCAAAGPLMDYLAQCAPERIPLTLMEGAIDDAAESGAALIALTEFSLLKRDPFEDNAPAVTVHRLVQVVARARTEARGGTAAAAAATRVMLRLAEIYPTDGYENPALWSLCAQLTPHLLARCGPDAAHGDGSTKAANLLDRAGCYLFGRGTYSSARPLLERALMIYETVLGPEHIATARSMNNLANLSHLQGDLIRARMLYERALAVTEKVGGLEHPDTAMILHGLAMVLDDQGDPVGAWPFYERALTILASAFGPGHLKTVRTIDRLASSLSGYGNFAAALPLFKHTLAIREKLLGPEHRDTSSTLNRLAILLQAQGDFTAARPLFERALMINEKVLGPDHPSTASALNNLASLLQDQGDLIGARPLYERAVRIYEKVHGTEHSSVAGCLNNIAVLMRTQGDFDGARELYERALAITEKMLGPWHPMTANGIRNLAALSQAHGDLSGARQLFERALMIFETAFGSEHPDIASTLNYLVIVHIGQGDLENARPLFERAAAVTEKVLGPYHPDTALALNNLAALALFEGDRAGARRLLDDAAMIYERALGADHPDTLVARANRAALGVS
jgi:tetratricopeptide (TPR) repeat protein/transcriptional regulator with XRE-family HTH domain